MFMATTKNPNHLAALDNTRRDYASANGAWWGTKPEGTLYFWRSEESDEVYTPTFEAKTLTEANAKIDALEVLAQAGVEKVEGGFQVGNRVATADQWTHEYVGDLATHLFMNGLALEDDVQDTLNAMRTVDPS